VVTPKIAYDLYLRLVQITVGEVEDPNFLPIFSAEDVDQPEETNNSKL
jgi:hypothetical protein